MILQDHQQRIAARILSHPDLNTANVIVEADVPDVQSAVIKSLQQGLQCIVVAMGGGQAAGESLRDPTLVLEERIIVTVGQIPGIGTPVLSPIQIIDRLIPWLHYLPWNTAVGAGFYLVSGHSPLDGESGVSGHQLVISTRVAVCP